MVLRSTVIRDDHAKFCGVYGASQRRHMLVFPNAPSIAVACIEGASTRPLPPWLETVAGASVLPLPEIDNDPFMVLLSGLLGLGGLRL